MYTSDKRYAIFGTGGFGREVLACIRDLFPEPTPLENIVVFLVSDCFYDTSEVMGVPVIKLSEFDPALYEVVVAIGEPSSRKSVVESLPSNTKYGTLIHPSAVVSQWADIGRGSIITAGAVITCNIRIGNHAHINLNSTIGHDCLIGDYFTLAPGVNVSGNCCFGSCVYFGTNAAIREGLFVTDNVTIGMGASVTKNIDSEGTYIGSPARKMANQTRQSKYEKL